MHFSVTEKCFTKKYTRSISANKINSIKKTENRQLDKKTKIRQNKTNKMEDDIKQEIFSLKNMQKVYTDCFCL